MTTHKWPNFFNWNEIIFHPNFLEYPYNNNIWITSPPLGRCHPQPSSVGGQTTWSRFEPFDRLDHQMIHWGLCNNPYERLKWKRWMIFEDIIFRAIPFLKKYLFFIFFRNNYPKEKLFSVMVAQRHNIELSNFYSTKH